MKSILVLTVLAAAAVVIYKAYQASQEEAKEARTVKALPPSVRHVVAQMDGASLAAFFNEYEQKKKKRSVGWLLWFFFGWHYIYAGKIGLQFAYWFTVGGLGIWAIADLFRMPSIIQSANDQIARQALQTLQLATSFRAPIAHPPSPGQAPLLGQAPVPAPNQQQPSSPPRYAWPTPGQAAASGPQPTKTRGVGTR